MAPALATLSECLRPSMGMRTWVSQKAEERRCQAFDFVAEEDAYRKARVPVEDIDGVEQLFRWRHFVAADLAGRARFAPASSTASQRTRFRRPAPFSRWRFWEAAR